MSHGDCPCDSPRVIRPGLRLPWVEHIVAGWPSTDMICMPDDHEGNLAKEIFRLGWGGG